MECREAFMLDPYSSWLFDDTYQLYPTIFYQGITQSQTQLAKYTGQNGFIATTGEHVKYKQNLKQLAQPLNVIKQPFIGVEIQDVKLTPFNRFIAYLNPLNWFLSIKSYLANWWYNIEISSKTHQSVNGHSLVVSNISLGQEIDINSHRAKFDALGKPEQGKILYGVSRGAATTFNALAMNGYTNVKLVVLEGCFSSVEDILGKRFGFFAPAVSKFLSHFTAYRPEGPSPISNIDNIPEDIPIAFISSKVDKEVPHETTVNLATSLAEVRRGPVYLLKLESSPHKAYMHNNLEDRQRYQQFIHAIFHKYNLAHIPVLANKGKTLLKTALLNPQEKVIKSVTISV